MMSLIHRFALKLLAFVEGVELGPGCNEFDISLCLRLLAFVVGVELGPGCNEFDTSL